MIPAQPPILIRIAARHGHVGTETRPTHPSRLYAAELALMLGLLPLAILAQASRHRVSLRLARLRSATPAGPAAPSPHRPGCRAGHAIACRSSSVRAPSRGPSCRGPRHAHPPPPVPARARRRGDWHWRTSAPVGRVSPAAGCASSDAAVFSHATLTQRPTGLVGPSLFVPPRGRDDDLPDAARLRAPTRRGRTVPVAATLPPRQARHLRSRRYAGSRRTAPASRCTRPPAASAPGCWRSQSGGARRPTHRL